MHVGLTLASDRQPHWSVTCLSQLHTAGCSATQTEASLSSSWASVNGTGRWNVTGPTNMMQASECDEHCNWNENEVFFGTAQVDALTEPQWDSTLHTGM